MLQTVIAEKGEVRYYGEQKAKHCGPMDKLLLPREVASILGVKVDTLRIWRRRGQGPDFCHIGRLCRYREIDVQEYVERSNYEKLIRGCAGAELRRTV